MTVHPQGWKLKNWSRRTSPPRKTSIGGGGAASPDHSQGNKLVQVLPGEPGRTCPSDHPGYLKVNPLGARHVYSCPPLAIG